MSEELNEICILKLSAIGDVCHTVPVVRTIQKFIPNARVTWIVGTLPAKLIGDLDGVRVLKFDKNHARESWKNISQSIGDMEFDALLMMQPALRASLLARKIRAKRKIGFDQDRSRDFQRFFTTESIRAVPNQHVQDSMFEFTHSLGIKDKKLQWDIPLSESDLKWGKQHCPPAERTLVINACASHPLRNWHAAGYAQVAEYASQECGFNVLLCGGRSDMERTMAAEIEQLCRVPINNLVGQDTLKQLLATLKFADVLITPDSGPMHMATAVGTPVIGLHAASNPARSGPYFSGELCVNRYPEAAKQFLKKSDSEIRWGQKIERKGVMDLITTNDVINRIQAIEKLRIERIDNTSP